ncbi:MAG TPA: hypothetical protein DDW94_05165 [Deltaproteobacteria bacterium]|nr:hypothetical protein [Deltaproteobacteria bacterium]HCY11562.1 hypothetical protein [Deltaproteobacteria bacterium]
MAGDWTSWPPQGHAFNMNVRRIDINLTTRKRNGSISSPAIAVFASIIAFVLTISNLNSYITNRAYIEVIFGRVKSLEEKLPREVVLNSEQDIKVFKRQVDYINGFVEKKVFSWTGLLSELEEVLPNSVYLLQISPDFEQSSVTISGSARNFDDILKAIDKMESGRFKKVILLNHSQKGNGPLIFNISAQYSLES